MLTGDTRAGLYIPPGVLHGFAALEDATLTYLVDRYHDAIDEHSVAWDDPTVAMDWGITSPILSGRDAAAPALADVEPATP